MKFTDPSKVCETIEKMRETDQVRSRNRVRINKVFNGDPPYSPDETQKSSIQTNVNFLEAANIAHNARSMFDSAFLSGGDHVSITLDYGPVHRRQEWSSIISKEMNRVLRRSLKYIEAQKQKFAQVVLHGIGPAIWRDRECWCPDMVGIDDFLVPSKTLRGFDNLDHYAVHRRMTVSQLWEMTKSSAAEKAGWNMPLVAKILARLTKTDPGQTNQDEFRFPEKLSEDIRANAGYYSGDCSPSVAVWDLYFLDQENDSEPKWCRRTIISDSDGVSPNEWTKEFLFNPKGRPYAEHLRNLVAVQYADGNNVAPFRYHSVRSLGFLLYSVAHLSNRLRCRMTDTTFREMMMLFRNMPAGDEERPQLIDLYDLGVIPEGLNFVTAQERYAVPDKLVMQTLSTYRQLMAENSARYTNDLNDGTAKEKTATQVMAEANAANALVGAMLGMAYVYEEFQDREMARRFCRPNSKDPDVKRFQKACLTQGVPPQAFDVEAWEVNRVRSLGNGNKTLQIAMADRLQAIRPQLDPAAQRSVDRIYVQANTDDPQLAQELVPLEEKPISASQEKASLAWGTLIDGKPVVLGSELNRIEYIEVLLSLLDSELQMLEQVQELPTMRRVLGLANVVQHIDAQVDTLAGDENEKQRVKIYSDALSRAGNVVKKLAQQLDEQMQASGAGIPQETMAKIQAMQVMAESKARIAEANAAQKRSHKEIAFQQDQARKDAKLRSDIAAKDATTQAEIIRESTKQALTPKPKTETKK